MSNTISCNFQISYDYGPKEERIKKQNSLSAFINDIVVRLLKTFIYPGAFFIKRSIIDPERIEKAKDQLIAMGGQPVTMTTPDGDKIDGMYLNAKDFKLELEKYCNILEFVGHLLN